MRDGWEESAAAWRAEMGERGDFSREWILDGPMMERVRAGAYGDALDVGCGEGRFCRMLRASGIGAIGIDPTAALIEYARDRDPLGDYRIGTAEAIELPDDAFDLVVSYLSLVDIAGAKKAIGEMTRVLRPGGSLLIANFNGFATAVVGGGWTHEPSGESSFKIDHYLTQRAEWAQWRGIRIRNWHRPLGFYLSLLIAQGLNLRYFSEPAPSGGDARKAALNRRVPLFVVMEWQKPVAP